MLCGTGVISLVSDVELENSDVCMPDSETVDLRFRIYTIKPAINTKNAIAPITPAQYISEEQRTCLFPLVPPAIAPAGEAFVTLLLDDEELGPELWAPVAVLARPPLLDRLPVLAGPPMLARPPVLARLPVLA
jgi:hypothetical protein